MEYFSSNIVKELVYRFKNLKKYCFTFITNKNMSKHLRFLVYTLCLMALVYFFILYFVIADCVSSWVCLSFAPLILIVIPLYDKNNAKYHNCGQVELKMSIACRRYIYIFCLASTVPIVVALVLQELFGAVFINCFTMFCTLIFKIDDKHSIFKTSPRTVRRQPPISFFAVCLIFLSVFILIFAKDKLQDSAQRFHILNVVTQSQIVFFVLIDLCLSIYFGKKLGYFSKEYDEKLFAEKYPRAYKKAKEKNDSAGKEFRDLKWYWWVVVYVVVGVLFVLSKFF